MYAISARVVATASIVLLPLLLASAQESERPVFTEEGKTAVPPQLKWCIEFNNRERDPCREYREAGCFDGNASSTVCVSLREEIWQSGQSGPIDQQRKVTEVDITEDGQTAAPPDFSICDGDRLSDEEWRLCREGVEAGCFDGTSSTRCDDIKKVVKREIIEVEITEEDIEFARQIKELMDSMSPEELEDYIAVSTLLLENERIKEDNWRIMSEFSAEDKHTASLLQSYQVNTTTYNQVVADFPKAFNPRLAGNQPGAVGVIYYNHVAQTTDIGSDAVILFGYLSAESSVELPAILNYQTAPEAFSVVCKLEFRGDILRNMPCFE